MIGDALRRLAARFRAEPEDPPVVARPDRPLTVDEMMPPPDVFSVGIGDFRAIGLGILEELKHSAGLAPHHHVLDVGCGIGRVAIPMTQYLSPQGSYEGFDPVRKAIRHCQACITPSYPNFRFQAADLYNKTYNPRGRFKDYEYRFPYADASFDIVFAVSVFTHLLPDGTRRYVQESTRVLKPGGRFFATWFLLNDASNTAIAAGRSTIAFPHRHAAHGVHSRRKPEAAVAYDEAFARTLYDESGLKLEATSYGTWSGRPPSGYGGYQDLLVATR